MHLLQPVRTGNERGGSIGAEQFRGAGDGQRGDLGRVAADDSDPASWSNAAVRARAGSAGAARRIDTV